MSRRALSPRSVGVASGAGGCWAVVIAAVSSSGGGVILTALVGDRFGPLAAGDERGAVGPPQEPVPRLAAGRDDGLVVRPDPQAELVLAQVLPDVLDRVQLGAVARQG